MNKSNLYEFAKNELVLLSTLHMEVGSTPICEEFMPQILELIESVGQSGQSGGSMSYTSKIISDTIHKLLTMQPISAITGADSEWCNITDFCNFDGVPRIDQFQNKRCPALFKNGINGEAYYIDAIVWVNGKDPNDKIIGTINDVTSRQYIKSFPFIPKTFYIKYYENFIDYETTPSFIYSINSMNEVFNYYKTTEECSKSYIKYCKQK